MCMCYLGYTLLLELLSTFLELFLIESFSEFYYMIFFIVFGPKTRTILWFYSSSNCNEISFLLIVTYFFFYSFLAKILAPEGSKDVPVGQPIAITVNCVILNSCWTFPSSPEKLRVGRLFWSLRPIFIGWKQALGTKKSCLFEKKKN